MASRLSPDHSRGVKWSNTLAGSAETRAAFSPASDDSSSRPRAARPSRASNGPIAEVPPRTIRPGGPDRRSNSQLRPPHSRAGDSPSTFQTRSDMTTSRFGLSEV
ncbi:MAG: hypothetical protein U0835_04545 [Isosphaeraceae bacterium]